MQKEISKEISLKIKALNKLRKKIKLFKRYAFKLSLEDALEFGNPYLDDVRELELQELLMLQEIQFLQREAKFSLPF
ncbi:hypothetical protein G4O51_12060 [Candidatus Bathyarchaeota archaeon A05DMB-2]|jgi:hypothetical protein|nr:hypothetical protein [Candidatus Bathyarchaeota archaeon A05DMB-2]